MTNTLRTSTILLACALAITANRAQADLLIDFEELSTFTTDEVNGGMVTGQYFNGDDGSGTSNSVGWTSQGVSFDNNYTNFGTFDAWQGWAYSNVVDTDTVGFFNEYAAVPGGGSDGMGGVDAGGNYAVAFTGSTATDTGVPLESSNITFAGQTQVNSVDLALTTYTARFIEDGLDGFGTPDFSALDQFGPGDFLELTIAGFDDVAGTGNLTGQVSVDLALDNTFLLDAWTEQDLSSLGEVRSLSFQLRSSQFSTFPGFGSFIDTPAYVAIDNLSITAVPEPSGFLLVSLAANSLLFRRRRSL